MAATRALGKLTRGRAMFFLCDMQERFRDSIRHFPAIIETNRRMVEASKVLDIPLVVTEQYPKALGHTVSELDIGHAAGVFPKTIFSMAIPDVDAIMQQHPSRTDVVLFGIETHVCILQTALDLLERGVNVHVVADAVGSRSQVDRKFALERMRQCGAFLTTTESVLFQLLGDSKAPNFKEVQALIKELPPDSGLLDL